MGGRSICSRKKSLKDSTGPTSRFSGRSYRRAAELTVRRIGAINHKAANRRTINRWGLAVMQTLEAIHTRRSVRKFLDKAIPLDVMRKILEAAIWAPSGGNRQPWRFVVVTDKEKIKKFDPYDHQPWVENAPAVIVACADPHDTWEKYDEEDDCYVLDTAAAIQNILLAIHDMGLGAVWVLTCSKRDIRKLLDIPLHWQIVSIIPFGYCDDREPIDAAKRSRRPLSEVAFVDSVANPIGPPPNNSLHPTV